MNYSVLLLFVLCATGVFPAVSVSRWFSATFYDLRFTLRRYGHCTGDLFPLRDYSLNETEYLIYQIRNFLDQGNYDTDQLANITALMDNICRSDIDQSYPISVNIDVNKFSNEHPEGKLNRCQAIDDALDSMFYVFKRAALNRSEPLDFSLIKFYPTAGNRSIHYNLTDLINTSWIKSETILEHVCNITDSVKRYVQAQVMAQTNTTAPSTSTSTSAADKRNSDQRPMRAGVFTTIFDMIDRILDPLLGLQKRLMWESNNRLEMVQSRLSSGLGSIRDGFGNRIKSTRDRLSGIFTSSPASNMTTVGASKSSLAKLNGTLLSSTAATGATTTTTTTISLANNWSNLNSSGQTSAAVTTVAPPSALGGPTPKAAKQAGTSLSSSPLVTNSLN